MDFSELKQRRQDCADTILKLYHKAHAGHIGASLSCLEILVDVCFQRLRPEDFVLLSKGHAALALYTVLAKCGRIDLSELDTYYSDNTRLAAHPPCSGEIAAIPFGTGSLGHGLSLAAGLVISQRFTGKNFRVYVIISEGDCNEGSTWEAALFAAHHKLSNLTVIMDANGLQGFGRSADVCDLEPLVDKWRAFGFDTVVVENGNDFASLAQAHASFKSETGVAGRPKIILAHTTKGHGVSYMQNKMEWHYLPMSEDQFRQAVQENQAHHA